MECLRLISTSTWGPSRHVERIEPMTEDMEKDGFVYAAERYRQIARMMHNELHIMGYFED